MRHLQSDYEKRLKDVETQKEQLLDEMESRETTLINKVIYTLIFYVGARAHNDPILHYVLLFL